ncbi:AAA family ATPase, partial [Sphingorhabdus sp.]|uniref:AAA family ATPase n=1 Tax=Sphingorhabdus sp. TaxID=1902408 RepID=UPI004048BB43
MKRHCRFNDEFYQMYQTTPNRLAPDRVWVVPGEDIHDLPETNFSPPLLLGYGDGVYYLLHHEIPAIMAFELDSFTPAMALRFATREYWEDCFGQDWWCPITLDEIEVAITLQSSKANVFGYYAAHRASWPYEEVEKRALLFDINEHCRWSPEGEPSDLVPIGYTKFIEIKFPEVRYIIPPFLTLPGLAMVFAERGVGKTLFVSHIAFAAATATSYLGWKAPRTFRVLILDGEMPAVELQKRYKAIERVTGIRPNPENLVFLAADLTPNGLPDLGTVEGQAEIEAHMKGFDLIIVDNLSTLCRTGAENEADSWGIMQAWAVKQRSLGRSVPCRTVRTHGTSFILPIGNQKDGSNDKG